MRFHRILPVLALMALFGVLSPLAAQNGTIIGRITDGETGASLGQASIQLLGGGGDTGVLADGSGQFRFSVASGSYSLVVSLIGYETTRVDGVRVRAGGSETVDVAMRSTVFALNPIVVTASRREEKRVDAPATVHVVGTTQIAERPAVTVAEHLRASPGIDVIQQGVQSTNVVVRGFNNIFSGALHALTDNRIAGLPSLRVNLLHFIPSNQEDLDRIEVVLGPGSALYGPNTANGVIHIITKSPLDHQGTTVTLGGGEKSVFEGSFRTSHLLSDNFGVKVSGQYVTGDEWVFNDPTEAVAKAAALADPTEFKAELERRGVSAANAATALARVGDRDFSFTRWGADVRADWAFSDDGTLMLSGGATGADGIELTGLGAGQTNDWIYSYYQARVNKGRFFTQTYINLSDSGDSFLVRSGDRLVDESRMFVWQAQHGFNLGDRVDVTYGTDFFNTEPRTGGTINGINEDIDEIQEWGFYVQPEIALHEKLDLVLAGRLDTHSELEDNVFSPRAALVFKPTEDQSFRVTFNRAFSTPSTLNMFLDISGGIAPDPLGPLGYRVRAQGPSQGFTFRNADGSLVGMRSPFNPGGADQLLPANSATMWQLAVGVLAAQGRIDAQTAQLLGSFNPSDSDIGINVLNPSTLEVTPLANATIDNVARLQESTTTTYEVGYQGVIGDRVSLAADVWYMEREDFISPLVLRTPLLLLDGAAVGGYLTQNFAPAVLPGIIQQLMQLGLSFEQAQAQALTLVTQSITELATGIAQLPIGVVSSDEVDASAADLLVTYINAGTVELWGGDLALTAILNDEWTLGASFSFTSKDFFDIADVSGGVEPIALNAPDYKGSLSLTYRNVLAGFNAEARVRFTSEFPVRSADFVGTACLGGAEANTDPCVEGATMVDLTVGYRIPGSAATLQLAVTNLFDNEWASFTGVPEIGRFALARVKYDLF